MPNDTTNPLQLQGISTYSLQLFLHYLPFLRNDGAKYPPPLKLAAKASAANQYLKFTARQVHKIFIRRWRPIKATLLYFFRMQPKTIPVPFKYFNNVPAPVAEHKHSIAVRVELETILD